MPIDKIRLAVIRERDRRGLSNAELARMTKGAVGYTTIHQWMKNEKSISARRASVILDALGLKVQGELDK